VCNGLLHNSTADNGNGYGSPFISSNLLIIDYTSNLVLSSVLSLEIFFIKGRHVGLPTIGPIPFRQKLSVCLLSNAPSGKHVLLILIT
jgi:hypothetical protein